MGNCQSTELSPQLVSVFNDANNDSYPIFNITEEPGIVKGSYDYGELLGKGAHGEVNEGTGKLDKLEVAIKSMTLDMGNMRSADVMAKVMEWKNEVQNLATASKGCIHITALYGTFVEKRKVGTETSLDMFVIMERGTANVTKLLCGEWYKSNSVLRERLLDCSMNTFQAQLHMHKHGIIHRDVKLSNIVYDPVHKIFKLTDLGISTRKLPGKGACGTPRYRPREQATDESTYDHTVDYYSYGANVGLEVLCIALPEANQKYATIEFSTLTKNQVAAMCSVVGRALGEDFGDFLMVLVDEDPKKRGSAKNHINTIQRMID